MPVVENSNYESNMKHLVGNNPIGQLLKTLTQKATAIKRAKLRKQSLEK